MNNDKSVSDIVSDFFRQSGANVADKVDREILGIYGVDTASGDSITKNTLVAVKDGKMVAAEDYDDKWRKFQGTARTQQNVFHREYQNAPYIDPTRQVDLGSAGDQAQNIASLLENGMISTKTAGELMGIDFDEEYKKMTKMRTVGQAVDPAGTSVTATIVDGLYRESQRQAKIKRKRKERQFLRKRTEDSQNNAAFKRIEYAIDRKLEAGGSCWFCKQDLVRFLKVDDKTAGALIKRAARGGRIIRKGRWWVEAAASTKRSKHVNSMLRNDLNHFTSASAKHGKSFTAAGPIYTFNRALTTQERQVVEAGVRAALPINHPYK